MAKEKVLYRSEEGGDKRYTSGQIARKKFLALLMTFGFGVPAAYCALIAVSSLFPLNIIAFGAAFALTCLAVFLGVLKLDEVFIPENESFSWETASA